jgi:hypothetical protein
VGDYIATPFQSSHAEVQKKIEAYLLNNMPRLYKQKEKCGQLQSYVDLIEKESTKEAQNLINRGMIENEAWNIAILQQINRTEINNRQTFY